MAYDINCFKFKSHWFITYYVINIIWFESFKVELKVDLNYCFQTLSGYVVGAGLTPENLRLEIKCN